MQEAPEDAATMETIKINISPKAMCFYFVQDKFVWHGAWSILFFKLKSCRLENGYKKLLS